MPTGTEIAKRNARHDRGGGTATTYRRLLGYARPYAGRVAAASLLSVLVAAATSAYAYLAGPVLRLLVTGGGGITDWGPLSALGRAEALAALPIALVVMAAVRAAAQFGYATLMQTAGQRIVADVRRDLYGRLLDLSPAFHDRRHSGDLLSRFVGDVQAVDHAVTYALASYVKDGIQSAALLATCALLDLRLLGVALVVAPIGVWTLSRFGRSLKEVAGLAQASLGRLAVRTGEAVANLRVLQAYRAEQAHLTRLDADLAAHLTLMRRSFLLRGAFTPVLELMAVVGLAVAIAAAAHQIAHGDLTAEQFLSFVAALLLMYQPLKALVSTRQLTLTGLAAASRVFEVVDARSEVSDAPAAQDLAPFAREIALQDVRLSYGDVVALDRVSLEIRRGETVALVGPSGGGKTSVASLLLRFYDPRAGRVVFDGVDIRSASLASLRRQIALVTQEPFLFAGSVRENIACARREASEAEVVAAAKAANAWEFVEKMPAGLDSPVGERGALLSGGQRQRVAIARAFLKDAPILVLDEATSSLDAASEAEVQKGLAELERGRTVLVIAHRLATVRGAHRTLVIDRGHIVEEGDHSALLAREGLYARLWAQGAT